MGIFAISPIQHGVNLAKAQAQHFEELDPMLGTKSQDILACAASILTIKKKKKKNFPEEWS